MKLHLFNYICGNCSNKFQVGHLPEELDYGYFLLRSEGMGSVVYLNSFVDTVFDEFANLMRKNKFFDGLNDLEQSDLFQRIFGIACDPDIDGSLFRINLKPKCPKCGQRNIIDWSSTEPPIFVDKNIPNVTHNKWNTLSNDEKLQLIKIGVKQVC